MRQIPKYSYVINLTKPFAYYRYRMHQRDFAKHFGRFYKEEHGYGRTVCLLGMRADLLIKNIGIIMRAGFPSNSKMYGVLQLYTTGQTPMCGARIIDLIMTTIIYMISFKSRPVSRVNLWYVQMIWGKNRIFVNNSERLTSGVTDLIIRKLIWRGIYDQLG